MPIAAGENASTSHDFASLASEARCDYLQPSVTKVGGISGFLEVAQLPAAHGVALAPDSPYFGPGLLATLQMALFPAVRSVDHLYARLEAPLFGDVGVPDASGHFSIPTGPGLGADLDAEVLRRYRVA